MENEHDYLSDDYVDWDEFDEDDFETDTDHAEHTSEFWDLYDNEFFEG